ncbi:MAG: aspartate aminotransferase [Thermotogaceae bacterium]|nr:aspartate aminotransferase [Thermotogaceae bacterium]MDN5338104.1 aspartate aminotransferase [Thermotogaceae bacterium]
MYSMNSSLSSIEPSITMKLNTIAKSMKAQGIDVVDLTAGEPDFPTPKEICEAAIDAINQGFTKYTPATGIQELRERIASKLSTENNIPVTAKNIVVTNGAKSAIFGALSAVVNPGDDVIVVAPSWVSYIPQIKLLGARPVVLQANSENNFIPEISKLQEIANHKTKAIIINSPNNPTGVVYPEEFFKDLVKLAEEKEFYIISDEIYEKLIYEGRHLSPASINPEVVITINGFSKAYSMTGWRVGYVAASDPIISNISKFQSHTASNVNSIAQKAALKALDVNTDYMVEEFRKRRDFLISEFEKINIKFVKPMGAFYFFMDFSDLIGKFSNGKELKSGFDICETLLKEYKLALVPGEGFEAPGFVRLSFAASMESLEKAVQRLKNFLDSLV